MENGANIYHGDCDEISLMEIISIIIKRKWVVVGCLLFTVIITFFYSLTKKPVYESKAVIQVGYNGERISAKVSSIEDPMSLAWILKNAQGLASVKVEKMDKYNLDILTYTSRNGDPHQAQASLKKATDDLLNRHNLLYNQMLTFKRKRLDVLKKQLQSVQAQLQLFEKRIPQSTKDNTDNILMVLEKEKLVKNQFELEQNLAEQELLLSENYIRPTRLLIEPTLSLKPIGRGKLFYIGLATVLGILAGVMVAFFVEFFQNNFSSGFKNMSTSK